MDRKAVECRLLDASVPASDRARLGLPIPAATFFGFALAFTAIVLIGGYSLMTQRDRIALDAPPRHRRCRPPHLRAARRTGYWTWQE